MKKSILEAEVYVGTYGKYNAGSIDGKWLRIADYATKEDFHKACKELHADEDDPEFMFQDWENIPDELIDEAWISPKVFELIQAVDDLTDTEQEAFFLWCNDTNQDLKNDDAEELVEMFRDCYEGEYDSEEDYARHVLDEDALFDKMGSLSMYFDYEAFARDLFICDYLWDDGYVFRRA